MSAMSELATELESHWSQAAVGCYWTRQLPNGNTATISTWRCGIQSGYNLTVNREEVWRGASLAGALVAAGTIARKQLATQAEAWAR